MRTPLEKIEWVDKYITGKLTKEEKQQFIHELKTDTELQQFFKIQQEIIQTVQRKALKAEISKTIKNINSWSRLWKWIVGAGILTAVAIAVLIWHQPASLPLKINTDTTSEFHEKDTLRPLTIADSARKEESIPVVSSNAVATPPIKNKNLEIEFHGLKTWVNPDIQTFECNPSKGATLIGKEGTLVIVPSDAFLDEQNQLVTDPVEIKMIEALRLSDMVLYNLGTTADGKALETGGMLNFDFSCLGKPVKVNPKRPLYVEVPTDEVKKEMMVFKGEVTNGKINWKDPQPIKKYLRQVDFNYLDFLPPYFADTVKAILPEVGYHAILAATVDSLYYSLKFDGDNNATSDVIVAKVDTIKKKSNPLKTSSRKKIDEAPQREQSECCGIDPVSIKTIKTPPYARTFVATQEFAERVRTLQKQDQGDELLQVYLKNLTKDMAFSDSIVAGRVEEDSKQVFAKFAQQKLTNVMKIEIYQDQLNAYYEKEHKENAKAIDKLQKELRNKNAAELMKLIKEADSGNPDPVVLSLANQVPVKKQVYAFQWSSPGWVNIDTYLHLLDKGSEEIAIHISGAEGITEVYQWLNTIKNLTPLAIQDNSAKALFPKKDTPEAEQMQNTFCFAISKNDDQYKWFDLRYNPYKLKTVKVDLKPTSIAEIRSKLKAYDVKQDLEKRFIDIEKQMRVALHYGTEMENKLKTKKKPTRADELMLKEMYWKKVRSVLRSVAFPCEGRKQSTKIKKEKLDKSKPGSIYIEY